MTQMTPEMMMTLGKFITALQANLDDYFEGKWSPNADRISRTVVDYMEGPKYIRLTTTCFNSRSVYGFVDKVTGDVYYPKGWAGPSKSTPVRGNIVKAFQEALTVFGPYGMKTLR